MELIPAIDLMQGKVVRLTRGDPKSAKIYSENPLAMARHWEAEGADALHMVDLDAALGINSGAQSKLIVEIVEALKIPVQVGGGVRTINRINDVLSVGVRRVIVGTLPFQNRPDFEEALHQFGAERIVVALDYAQGKVMIKGWQEATALEPLDALKRLRGLGARQFLMTAISQDGTLAGADLDVLARATAVADAEIYASGGIATVDDVRKLKQIGVKGFIVGKALYEGALTMEQLRNAIADCGLRIAD
ncbi:MAG: 1-(5-phosphoribosyl)-5-[(5-phosphoribosylamino)methylideneamino]imidazole-4-carboxamide isomerase [Acidobacteria bacterium]|nr:1-(5-phosphoribosyl)-5-[(5-phosphoribosylamino)methylideneamino]imidazole-4-carboxamide isomerase [Acidobacteriota bacterium]